jgi:hypothetical protein
MYLDIDKRLNCLLVIDKLKERIHNLINYYEFDNAFIIYSQLLKKALLFYDDVPTFNKHLRIYNKTTLKVSEQKYQQIKEGFRKILYYYRSSLLREINDGTLFKIIRKNPTVPTEIFSKYVDMVIQKHPKRYLKKIANLIIIQLFFNIIGLEKNSVWVTLYPAFLNHQRVFFHTTLTEENQISYLVLGKDYYFVDWGYLIFERGKFPRHQKKIILVLSEKGLSKYLEKEDPKTWKKASNRFHTQVTSLLKAPEIIL